MNSRPYQDRIFPLQPNRVWRSYQGGRLLDEISGAAPPADTHFPEDWIGSTTRAVNPGREDIVEGVSTVQLEGEALLLPALIALDPHYFLGSRYLHTYGQKLAPLVKFLDSAVRLHFQCHPTIPFARKHFNSPWGKAEAYHILSVRPEQAGGYIYMGFQRPPSREEMRRMVLEQDIEAMEACFDPIPVHPGDTFFVPGGVPHAIGPGVLMVEVMEPTDFVARFEWTKCGYTLPEAARFMGREVDFGLDMLDFAAVPASVARGRFSPAPLQLEPGRTRLLGSPFTNSFQIELLETSTPLSLARESHSINIVLAGELEVQTPSGFQHFTAWDRFLVPAGIESVTCSGNSRILSCLPFGI